MFRFDSIFRFKRRPRLWVSLSLNVVVPLALLSAAAVYISLVYVESGFEDRMQEDVQLIARAIQLPVSRSLARNKPRRMQEALRSAFSIRRVYGAYVYNMYGRRVAEAGVGTPALEQLHLMQLAASGRSKGEYDRVSGRPVYSYFLPLYNQGNRIIGLLQVTRRRTDFIATMTRLHTGAAIVVLSMLAVITIVVFAGHQRAIGRHLARLSVVMRRVRKGEREQRAQSSGPREIAALADALNNMLDSISLAEREIALRQESEEELTRRLHQTEKLATLGRFAAGIAHELGGPLSVIDGKARRVLRHHSGDTDGEIQAIRREVERASRVIRQILALARRGTTHRRRRRCDKIFSAAAEAVRDDAQAAGTTLTVSPGPNHCEVNVEPMRMRQALVNLLHNAIDATPGGRVEVSWETEGDWVHLRVMDDGPGVEPGMRQQIFEPFFTTRNDSGGTGLGLALAQGIVLDHDGRLYVVDNEPRGACFRLELPLASQPEVTI